MAPSGDLERLTTLLRDTLQTSGYARRHPANTREPVLRRLVRRMALTAADAQVWTGILRQFEHALRNAGLTETQTDVSPSDE